MRQSRRVSRRSRCNPPNCNGLHLEDSANPRHEIYRMHRLETLTIPYTCNPHPARLAPADSMKPVAVSYNHRSGRVLDPRDRDNRFRFGVHAIRRTSHLGCFHDPTMSQNVTLGTKFRPRSISKSNSIRGGWDKDGRMSRGSADWFAGSISRRTLRGGQPHGTFWGESERLLSCTGRVGRRRLEPD